MEFSGPNAQQMQYWNEQAGPVWVRQQAALDRLIEPLGRAAIERAGVAAGERVLDSGCGTGQTAVALGESVGASGQVLGIDLSVPMLDAARERASRAGLAHVRFEQADAQTHDLPRAHFDLLFSRFGVMFFADPPAAFANLRRALRPGGRATFVCWQALERNAWMREPLLAVLKHVSPPAPPEPGAPGPFSFADPEHVRGIVSSAGFGQVAIEPLERELLLGGDVEQALEFTLNVGIVSALLREADPALREAVRREVRAVVERFASDAGVALPCAAWIVSARA